MTNFDHNANSCPTTAEVAAFLLENDWTKDEISNLFGYYWRNVNQDGTTTLSFDTWTRVAEEF